MSQSFVFADAHSSRTDSSWFDALVNPKSIAIVGASGKSGSLFARPLELLVAHRYEGEIFVVNPNYESIAGFTSYPRLEDVPGNVDLVLMLVRASQSELVIAEAGRKGAASAIVFASGFAETGSDGRDAQRRLQEAGRRAGVRILGPNCQGVVFAPNRVVATFTAAADELPQSAGFAYVGQSGAVGGSILDVARERGLGATAWFSVGNEADLTAVEVAAATLELDEVKVMALYLESISDGRALVRLASRAKELDKSLVVLRSGRTESGWRAGVSHTGALNRPGRAFSATAERFGVHLVEDVHELVEASLVLLGNTPHAGRRVGVVTTSGGAGSIAADHLELAGLCLPELPAETRAELATLVPDFGAVENPVDVTAQLFASGGSEFIRVCEILAGSDAIDQIVIVVTMLTGETAAGVARDVAALSSRVTIPIHVCWLASAERTRQARDILRDASMPVFDGLKAVARSAAVLAAPAVANSREWEPEPDPAFSDLPSSLTEAGAAELLDAAGVRRPKSILITDPSEAAEAVAELGGVAVCKLQASDVAHKSDHGLVRLGVTSAEAVEVVADLMAAKPDCEGVLVQEQIGGGFEMLVGITADTTGLPPLLTVGSGGVAAEVWGDVASASLPLVRPEVEALILSLRSAKLLRGFRGSPGFDFEGVVDAILGIVGAASLLGGRLIELEINPLIVGKPGQGAVAADAVINLRPRENG